MYVVIAKRVLKVGTGATAKFAPRTANRIFLTVSGPFTSLAAAQHAVLQALGTHSCLDAQAWSAEAVQKRRAQGSSRGTHEEQEIFRRAEELLCTA